MPALTDFISDATREDAQRLDEALLRNESLRWALRPVPTPWGPGSLPALIFSIPWLCFVTFWTYAALGFPTSLEELAALQPGRMLFAAFSLPFWAVGIWMLTTPWQQQRRMRRSIYALTDRRVLIIEPGLFSWKTRAFALVPELIMERKLRKEGRGDLIFGTDVHYGRNSRREVPVGFINLPDLRLAEQKIDEALDAKLAARQEKES